jgi:hypothetical protein
LDIFDCIRLLLLYEDSSYSIGVDFGGGIMDGKGNNGGWIRGKLEDF